MVRVALAAAAVLALAAAAGAAPNPVQNGLIVFTTERASTSSTRRGAAELATVRPDGRDLRFLVRDGIRKSTPAWSPYGQEVAYGRAAGPGCSDCDSSIAVLDVRSGRQRELTRFGQPADPSWSPDGTTIAFDTADGGVPAYRIMTVRRDGSDLRILGEGVHPSWSPDGSQIVFFRYPKGLYVTGAGADGGRPLGVRGANPAWSPVGEQIAYEYGGCLRLARPDGSKLGPIPHTRHGSDPAWSPDGRWIVFERDDHLWMIHPDGSAARRLTSGDEVDRAPSWQPVAG